MLAMLNVLAEARFTNSQYARTSPTNGSMADIIAGRVR
jgi:hypothetical protein